MFKMPNCLACILTPRVDNPPSPSCCVMRVAYIVKKALCADVWTRDGIASAQHPVYNEGHKALVPAHPIDSTHNPAHCANSVPQVNLSPIFSPIFPPPRFDATPNTTFGVGGSVLSDWGDILTNYGSPFSPVSGSGPFSPFGFGAMTPGVFHASNEYSRLLLASSPKFGEGRGVNVNVGGQRGGAHACEESAHLNVTHALGEEESMSIVRELHGVGNRDAENVAIDGGNGSGVTTPK